ncbi:hypothetical protein BHM03_00027757 [Ensete ventricosum]|nr:hypothetical protein BHM03_00027757 [Ensete ventricosum]
MYCTASFAIVHHSKHGVLIQMFVPKGATPPSWRMSMDGGGGSCRTAKPLIPPGLSSAVLSASFGPKQRVEGGTKLLQLFVHGELTLGCVGGIGCGGHHRVPPLFPLHPGRGFLQFGKTPFFMLLSFWIGFTEPKSTAQSWRRSRLDAFPHQFDFPHDTVAHREGGREDRHHVFGVWSTVYTRGASAHRQSRSIPRPSFTPGLSVKKMCARSMSACSTRFLNAPSIPAMSSSSSTQA